jgi:hypothetical protein
MPQAVEVIGEPEEQGLADLHGPAAAGGRGKTVFVESPRRWLRSGLVVRTLFAGKPGTSDNQFPLGGGRGAVCREGC